MSTSSRYKWAVVAMLWWVCFFNYADRQAIFSVFPLLKQEFQLSDPQLGQLGSAFLWVYATAAPFAGMVGDRFRRKTVILGGFFLWSIITILTALSRKLSHLIFWRAAEGLGEAFYFPASMSLVSDYHGRRTRSRAMSLHQSSVYAGTIGGGAVAGFMGEHYGWGSTFYLFGIAGALLSIILVKFIREPRRGQAEMEEEGRAMPEQEVRLPIREALPEIFSTPTALVLMAVFFQANFVAWIFLTWMPSFIKSKFALSLTISGITGTAFLQTASVIGVLTGGWLADRLSRRSSGGRMQTQLLGLICGAPFIFVTGTSLSVPLLIIGMTGFGFFKGLYDANIFASLYDVIRPEARATAAGMLNMVGNYGGALAPIVVGVASERIGMSAAIAYGGFIYLLAASLLVVGLLAFVKKDAAALKRALAGQPETA
jgi:MFS family permease